VYDSKFQTKGMEMKEKRWSKSVQTALVIVCFAFMLTGAILADQDRFTLKAPNGIAFSGFNGYRSCQNLAVSRIPAGIKAIPANPVMINAYKAGIPGNGKPFSGGSMLVKEEFDAVSGERCSTASLAAVSNSATPKPSKADLWQPQQQSQP